MTAIVEVKKIRLRKTRRTLGRVLLCTFGNHKWYHHADPYIDYKYCNRCGVRRERGLVRPRTSSSIDL